jgi:hypothetical protein
VLHKMVGAMLYRQRRPTPAEAQDRPAWLDALSVAERTLVQEIESWEGGDKHACSNQNVFPVELEKAFTKDSSVAKVSPSNVTCSLLTA